MPKSNHPPPSDQTSATDAPATPTNIPYIGQTKVRGLWVNAGHGTLGWTHGAGSGKAMAELISGVRPPMKFGFYGIAA